MRSRFGVVVVIIPSVDKSVRMNGKMPKDGEKFAKDSIVNWDDEVRVAGNDDTRPEWGFYAPDDVLLDAIGDISRNNKAKAILGAAVSEFNQARLVAEFTDTGDEGPLLTMENRAKASAVLIAGVSAAMAGADLEKENEIIAATKENAEYFTLAVSQVPVAGGWSGLLTGPITQLLDEQAQRDLSKIKRSQHINANGELNMTKLQALFAFQEKGLGGVRDRDGKYVLPTVNGNLRPINKLTKKEANNNLRRTNSRHLPTRRSRTFFEGLTPRYETFKG